MHNLKRRLYIARQQAIAWSCGAWVFYCNMAPLGYTFHRISELNEGSIYWRIYTSLVYIRMIQDRHIIKIATDASTEFLTVSHHVSETIHLIRRCTVKTPLDKTA